MPNTAILEKVCNVDLAQMFSACLPGWSIHKTPFILQSQPSCSSHVFHGELWWPWFSTIWPSPSTLEGFTKTLQHLVIIDRAVRRKLFSSSEHLRVLLHCVVQRRPWLPRTVNRRSLWGGWDRCSPAVQELLVSGLGKACRPMSQAVTCWHRGEHDP